MKLNGSVLIIDDEANIRHTLTRILRQAGCEVGSAADGSEALRMLTTANYNLVFLDLRLPDMDGLQVLKKIRDNYPQISVVLLTGHGSLKSALDAIHLGARDYLLKPIDPQTLLLRTQEILDELAVENRRREIQDQIETLQNELRELEGKQSPELTATEDLTKSDSRFLNRGKLILDLQAQRVTFGDNVLNIPPATFDYLVTLVRHAPNTVAYQTLVAEAQGYQTNQNEARELAKWHIHVLRQVIESDPKNPQFILNIRGVGYRLIMD
jgi:DNA-binding response OmpR family regulator